MDIAVFPHTWHSIAQGGSGIIVRGSSCIASGGSGTMEGEFLCIVSGGKETITDGTGL
jgi:hypothetical protein